METRFFSLTSFVIGATSLTVEDTIDSSYSSILSVARSRAPETAPVFMEPDEPLKLRVYPSGEDSTGVSLRSQGRDSQLKALDAWQMEDIYT